MNRALTIVEPPPLPILTMHHHTLARLALTTSLAIHIAALSGLAAWSSNGQRATIGGSSQQIQLTIVPVRPPLREPLVQFEFVASTPPKPIEPASHWTPQRPRQEAPSADRALELTTDPLMAPRLNMKLAARRASSVEMKPIPDLPQPDIVPRRTRYLAPDAATEVSAVTPTPTQGTAADFSRNPPPAYPPLAIRNGWEGTVLLRVAITAEGRVEKVEVARTSGFRIFDSTAVAAVQRWRATPATRNGQAVATVEVLPVQFKLNN